MLVFCVFQASLWGFRWEGACFSVELGGGSFCLCLESSTDVWREGQRGGGFKCMGLWGMCLRGSQDYLIVFGVVHGVIFL